MIRLLKHPMFTVGVRYGLISGFMCLCLVITFYYFGKSPMLINPYTDFRILLFGALIFFLLKELRDYYFVEAMYFWQGMGASFVFILSTVLISSLGIIILGNISPDFLTQYTTQLNEQLLRLPAETIEQIGNDVYNNNLKLIPKTTLGDVALVYTIQSFIIGFFVSIIMSVFLKRAPTLEK